jgi:hypothetical protein
MPAYDPDRPNPTFAPKMSTSRGVLILDEALQALRPHLETLNFIVFFLPPELGKQR